MNSKIRGMLVQVNVIDRDKFNTKGIQLRFKTDLLDKTISRTYHFPKRYKASCLIYKQLTNMGLTIFEGVHEKPYLLASAIEEVALFKDFYLLVSKSGKDEYPYNIEEIFKVDSNINSNLSVNTQI